jgi:hypothetical protein
MRWRRFHACRNSSRATGGCTTHGYTMQAESTRWILPTFASSMVGASTPTPRCSSSLHLPVATCAYQRRPYLPLFSARLDTDPQASLICHALTRSSAAAIIRANLGDPGAAGLTICTVYNQRTAFDALVWMVVWLFLASICTKTRHRLACLSTGARYQPGAAHQKGAIATTTAPCWNPRGRRLVHVPRF